MNPRPSETPEYLRIARFYGDRRARRSGVLLMNHIDEGLLVLAALRADALAERAFCLHPIVQTDEVWDKFRRELEACPEFSDSLPVALEYRIFANSFLSSMETHPGFSSAELIDIGQNPLVRDMLIADKVQNRKDFEKHHQGRHPRSKWLECYFERWFERLNITPERYSALLESTKRGAPTED